MRISLVIPPSAFLLDDRAFPFLGPLQIGALARQLGHDVRVHDLTGYKRRHPDQPHAQHEDVLAEARAQLGAELAEHKPELVGCYSLAAQHPMVVALLPTIREAVPSAVVALGGPHANTAPERCVQDGFDAVVVSDQGGGGGEPGFLRLLDNVERGLRPPRKASLPMADGKILRVPSRAGEQWELDRWPLPARDLIDLPSYRYTIKGEPATSIVSATGCPYACVHCSHWEGYRKLEAKSSPRVREEIVGIRRDYGLRGIMFYDDEINLRPDFREEFLPMLSGEGVVWRAFFKNGRNLTVPAVFDAMAAAGCAQLCTGAEAAHPDVLKNVKKGATLADNTAFVRECVRVGIAPKVFTQVGLPGETPESVEALATWLEQMADEGLSDADCSITTPYEGTPLFDHPDRYDTRFDKDALDFSNEVVLYKGIPGEYKSYVSYDRLSPDDIVAARQMVEDRFRRRAGLAPLLAKDDG